MPVSFPCPRPRESIRGCRLDTFTTAGAVALLCWEICITFDDELKYIWPKPNSSLLKWLFLFHRYFALCAQLSFRIACLSMFNTSTPITLHMCKVFWICQAAAAQSLMLSIDIILMMRVYYLYNRKRWMGILLFSIFSTGHITQGISAVHAFSRLHYHPVCLVIRLPHSLVYYRFAVTITHLIILGLTAWKHVFALFGGWGSTPILSLMLRDGILMFVIIGFMSIFSMVRKGAFGNHIFWWFLSIVSSFGCRVIINMQRLRTLKPSEPAEFTTECDGLGTGRAES
ncbi:hypothetical protein PILCRDRAFT_177324 [Piloderma croceum F 1598]|uniref:DUF6533 domain-containing protein n=1 Tax=Piloderma croceum (strain F 1598) TaxID=765440 RepID=A0A0C3BUP9_PILCF|nr:hypothetical protein PILCRDRAFT_177324 [Piloderma croceum F 1598]